MPFLFLLLLWAVPAFGQRFDVVIGNGRLIDPASGVDGVRNVGIRNGKIAAVSTDRLNGERVVDARGLVVAPGFIDLHWHGRLPGSDVYEAMDGVTASFELEVGVGDIDRYYADLEGRSLIHHGAAVGHVPVSGTSSEFSALVPPNTGFQLSVGSPLLMIADTSGKPLVQNALRTSLTSPALSSNVELSPLGRPIGPRIPARIIDVVATGLVAQ